MDHEIWINQNMKLALDSTTRLDSIVLTSEVEIARPCAHGTLRIISFPVMDQRPRCVPGIAEAAIIVKFAAYFTPSDQSMLPCRAC